MSNRMYARSPDDLFKGRTLHSADSWPEVDRHVEDVNTAAEQASSLPPGFLERGEVTSRTEMTTQLTDEEWEGIIADVEKKVEEEGDVDVEVDERGFNKTIDHTLLKLDATAQQIDGLCIEARENGFATVCVRPNWVKQSVENLKGSDVKVASVIGFHEGTYELSHKVQETKLSLDSGALELDIVLNASHLQSPSTIYNELLTLRSLSPSPILLKLILETSQLSRSQIIAACVLANTADFDFVKTSTGFKGEGATLENVKLMRKCCKVSGKGMKVKASGGIRDLGKARDMLRAGAERLGTSSGVALVREMKGEGTKRGDSGQGGY